MENHVREAAARYNIRFRRGDILEIKPCENPAGWWSILRNGQPIHHWQDKGDAEEFLKAVRGI